MNFIYAYILAYVCNITDAIAVHTRQLSGCSSWKHCKSYNKTAASITYLDDVATNYSVHTIPLWSCLRKFSRLLPTASYVATTITTAIIN